MDIQHILTIIGEFLGSGIAVYGLTEVAKRVNSIPVFSGQTLRIRAVAGVLSAIAVLLLGLANQDVKPDDLSGVLVALTGLVSVWLTSHATYKVADAVTPK